MPAIYAISGDGAFDLAIECPACNCLHGINTRADRSPRWTWNGNVNYPTISPSIHVKNQDGSTKCHSFVRDGMVEFCSDSALAGKTVPLPLVDL